MLWKILLSFGFIYLSLLINPSTSQLTLPLPSSISEIQPSLGIYSPTGNPPCFILPTSTSNSPASYNSKDFVIIAGGHGAWLVPLFITHSFKENGDTPWLHVLKNAILQAQPQTTVVLVGWGGGADSPFIKYNKAAGNIKSVGTWLGDIADELKRLHPHLYIWGIGNSLGAHLLGVAGRRSRAWDRITGIDPAAPLFHGETNKDLRLQSGDANLVDIIHSDGCSSKTTPNCWVALNNHYALLEPMGTIDFYPGYGELNPTQSPMDIDKSHTRGVYLFIVSVMNKGLFRTNMTLEGNPNPGPIIAGQRSLTIIKNVDVAAEMGFWLETGFIPRPVDSRSNFYIAPETLKLLSSMNDLTKVGGGDSSVMHGGRRRRELVRMVDCTVVPNCGAIVELATLGVLLLCMIFGRALDGIF